MMSNETAATQPEGKGRAITVVINGRKYEVRKNELTFEEVVALAFPNDSGNQIVYTITYRGGPPSNPDGILVPGRPIKIKEGMIFNVTRTDKS